MSIIGENFSDWVNAQVGVRQSMHGAQTRSNSELTVLSNQNAWIKLGSSVKIIDEKKISKENYDNLDKEEKKKININKIVGNTIIYDVGKGTERLQDLGFNNPEAFLGTQLAKKAVLFNTLSSFSKEGDGDGDFLFRKGIIDSNKSLWNDDKAYGLGGTTFGIVPPPGIISLDVKALNRGSIREANIQIKAQNKFQFELIELLYLRLGFSMLVEWGWNKYYDLESDSKNRIKHKLKQTQSTLLEEYWFENNEKDSFMDVIAKTLKMKRKYSGNYDAFLGKVTNFNWKFNTDGTYDITLKLLTVGDVIESLKANLPQQTYTIAEIENFKNSARGRATKLIEGNSAIFTNAGDCDFTYNLFSDIISDDTQKWLGKAVDKEGNAYKTNYLSILDILGKDLETLERAAKTQGATATIPLDDEKEGVIVDKYSYYLTLRELMTKIYKYIIPSLNGKKMLRIDTSDDQLCVIYPYQISLDPRICITRPFFFDRYSFNNQNQFNKGKTAGGEDSGIINYLPWQNSMNQFGIKDDKCVYGNIMEIYINYDFISEAFKSCMNNEGDVYLFKFLQKICDGINRSFGGVTKIEAVLNEDQQITFIDQSPIPGIENSKYADRFSDKSIPFEIFGFNPSGSGSSNFVRDFGFDTKIGPNIASMISIGATAEGIKTKNYDATGFSKWNEGLADRYAFKYTDPPPSPKTNFTPSTQYPPFTNEAIVIIKKHFENSRIDTHRGYDNWSAEIDVLGWLERDQPITSDLGYSLRGYRDIENCPITGDSYGQTTWAEYAEEVRDFLIAAEEKALEVQNNEDVNYISYLSNAFGGKIFGQPLLQPLYFKFDPDFIAIGIQSFKGFVNIINNKNYELTGNPSAGLAFIPLDMNLKCDGISGIKIYNQLKIRQEFLPSVYPKALKFVISQVGQKVEDNDWTTEIHTISTANTQNTVLADDNLKTVEFDITDEDLGDLIAGDPEPIINPGKLGAASYTTSPLALEVRDRGGVNGKLPADMLVDTDINWNGGGIERLNKIAWSRFVQWRRDVRALGYDISMREGYRDLEKQNSLYYLADGSINPKAAKPGASPHGWGGAVDLVMYDKNGTILSLAGITAKLALENRLKDTWKKIATIGSRYGWYNPWRLADRKKVDEAWHFEYWGPMTKDFINEAAITLEALSSGGDAEDLEALIPDAIDGTIFEIHDPGNIGALRRAQQKWGDGRNFIIIKKNGVLGFAPTRNTSNWPRGTGTWYRGGLPLDYFTRYTNSAGQSFDGKDWLRIIKVYPRSEVREIYRETRYSR